MALLLHNTLRTRTPVSKKTGVLWSRIAREVMGPDFDIAVVLIGDHRSHRLNRTYRGFDRPTNVLAFPVAKAVGEIYLNVPRSVKEAPTYDHSSLQHLTYLFIHGLLHLTGLKHGPSMEAREQRLLKRYASK